MDERAFNVSWPALFRQAAFCGLLLVLNAAAAGVQAQQGVLPPFVKDLAAVGVPINPQQPANPGADSRIPAGGPVSDPYHVFDKTVAGTPPSAPAAPTVLVLRNGRVVRGTVRADSRGYFVESPRSSLYFPFGHVRFVAADLHEAYVKLCDSIAGSSARRDLVLGRWCLENDLRAEAADHFRNVLNFEPANREARQGLATLAQAESEEPAQNDRANTPRASAEAPSPESLSRLSGPSVREFVSGIQPILLARCGNVKCHGASESAAPGVASFRLEQVRLSQGSNRAATSRNLDAVLALLDGQFPSQSPLFQRGLQPHGGLTMRAPLDGPSGRAQEMRLRRWVEMIAPERNRLRHADATQAFISRFARSQKSSTLRDPDVVPSSATTGTADDPVGPPEPAAGGSPPADASNGFRAPAAFPRQVGPLGDPFDPARFNAGQ